MKDNDKQSIIDAIAAMPCALEAEDVTDFCSLAQYYAMKTPSSFKHDLYPIMFGDSFDEKIISHALCLPVSAQELVENSIESPSVPNTSVESVRFFLVDCRPAEQYNAGHLPTAFHLDCNLVCFLFILFTRSHSECQYSCLRSLSFCKLGIPIPCVICKLFNFVNNLIY